ncbi:flagellar assembly protein FliW [Weizmannia acidilactici]|uniref:flagellar assembly protein FliW n=1 Tax=Weizmannia acidilactici TaxID=2607726 RepID=UPI00124EF628|nr:flagellar assembly protein FliW [Weizmannia acidilactici]GER72939.1 flagellar assembly factor FliW [Weizmannia acidilactici]
MKRNTKYHGEIEISESDIWHFENGIPGFPDEKAFVLLPILDNGVYMVLQSVMTPYVAFVITSPFLFFRDYEFNIDDATLEQLSIEKEEDVLVYAILTVRNPFANTTANLQAPLILNQKNHQAKQLILNDPKYKTRHPLFANKSGKVKG